MTRWRTKQLVKIQTDADDHRIAKLAAIAIGLHMFETFIPSPLPGVKPGLANIITLYVLRRYDFAIAAWVSILRVIASSFMLGLFLSPTFVLSLGGSIASLAILFFAQHLPKHHFGMVSLSVLSAFAHISMQLLIVRYWLIPHAGLLYLVPIFALAALIFGLLNGLLASYLLSSHPKSANDYSVVDSSG